MAIKQPKIIGRIIAGKFVPASELKKEEESSQPVDFRQTMTNIANRQQGITGLPMSSKLSSFQNTMSDISQRQSQQPLPSPAPSFLSRIASGIKETGKEILGKSPLVQAVQQKSFTPIAKPFIRQFSGKGFELGLTGNAAKEQGQKAMNSLVFGPSELSFGANAIKQLAKAKTKDAVIEIAKKNSINISDEVASKLSKETDANKVKNTILNIVKPKLSAPKIHPEDQAVMSDFTDYIAGSYKPKNTAKLELDATRVAEKYGINQLKTTKGLSSEFGRVLEQQGFKTPKINKAKIGEIVNGKIETPIQIPKESLAITPAVPPMVEFPKSPKFPQPQVFDASKYVQEQVAKQQLARKAETGGILQKGKDFYKLVKRKLVDLNSPIEDTIRDAQKTGQFEILPKADITNQIDRTLKSSDISGQFAKDNGLDTIIKQADNLDELDQYLIAKHAKTLESNGIKTGRNMQADDAMIQQFAPKYEAQAQAVNEYSRKLLDYSVDSGLISKKLAESLKQKYPNYVPMQRIFNELEQGTLGQAGGGKGVASLSKQTVVQKIVGSEREVESPIHSLLAKTGDAFKQGEKNKAARILASYKDLPNNPFNLRELAKDEVVGNKSTVSFLDNGVKRTFETTKEIAEAAKNLNEQQMNVLGKILAAPVRLAKLGITALNLPFVAANVVKDQMFSAIMSNKTAATSVANPINFVKALFTAVKHGELYDDMVRQGAMGTSFDIARSSLPQTVAKVRAGRSIGTKALYNVTHPGELLKAVEDIVGRSEELTRIQQYKGTLDALVKEGRTLADAKILASRAARENSVNFARRGEWGTVLNSAFLYLNANIQGSRTLVRNLIAKPVSTTAKLATVLYTPVAIATAWNMNDPKRKDAYDDISDYEKENNIIIVPDNPVKDEKTGKWNVIKIPLTPGISNSAQVVRRGVEQAYGADPVRFGEVARSLVGTVSPIEPSARGAVNTLTPQAVKPSLEALTNQSFFTGLPTVSQSKQKLSPELQVKENTSGTARQIAGKLDVSPLKTEAFIRGTGGGVAMQLLNASDRILAKFGVIPEDQIGGQNLIQAITARFSGATGGNASRKQEEILNDLITKQADERFVMKQTAEKLYEEWKKLPKEEANAKAEELKKTDKSAFEALKDVAQDEKLGLSYSERLVKQLGVENGERARFILEEAKKLKTREEKNAYIEDLRNKKIASDAVIAQLRLLNK